jgi:hypothetical protein
MADAATRTASYTGVPLGSIAPPTALQVRFPAARSNPRAFAKREGSSPGGWPRTSPPSRVGAVPLSPHRGPMSTSSNHRSLMPAATESTSTSRRLATVFSTRVFRALAAERTDVAERLAPLATVADVGTVTLANAFEIAHQRLLRTYRSEYLFKNALVSKIVFGRHRPTTASAILEMPMGNSEADVVVLNGTSTVYEIKTDLDQFVRLDSQLRDYCTHADRVYVVTSDSKAAHAESRVPDHVGVLALNHVGALTTIRPATSNLRQLRHEHLFRMLRRIEAETLLRERIGYTADVARGHLSQRMAGLFAELDIVDAHHGVIDALRRRGRSAAQLTTTTPFPVSLRALAYGTELSGIGQKRLLNRLQQPLALAMGVEPH